MRTGSDTDWVQYLATGMPTNGGFRHTRHCKHVCHGGACKPLPSFVGLLAQLIRFVLTVMSTVVNYMYRSHRASLLA